MLKNPRDHTCGDTGINNSQDRRGETQGGIGSLGEPEGFNGSINAFKTVRDTGSKW